MEGEATVDGLLDQVARARAAGRPMAEVVRMAADFLAEHPGVSPAERRDRLTAVVVALAGPGGDAGRAAAQLLVALEAAGPPAPPPGPADAAGPGPADPDWLWADPLGIPEAEDIGPPLDDPEIAEWEARHGVPLPAVLKRAYRQQDGGYVRGDRPVHLLRLRRVEPVEAGCLDGLWPEEGPGLDPARLFYLGWDDTGATVLLHYGEPGGAGPAVYAHYGDGGSIERIADTAAGLFRGAPA